MLWQRFKKVLSRVAGQQTAHPEPRLRLKLPRGWVDESGNNPQGGPTYVRAGLADSSVVQISIERRHSTLRMDAAEPVWWLTQLARSLAFSKAEGGEVEHGGGQCPFGYYGFVALTTADYPRMEFYYLGDGRELILATIISPDSKPPVDQEEARKLVLSCTLKPSLEAHSPIASGPASGGCLLIDGKFDKVCLTCEQLEKLGTLQDYDRSNWALALLNLRRYAEASELWQGLMQQCSTSGFQVDYGICQWFLGHRQLALEAWTAAQLCPYQPLGGGVETAALLYYAGMRTDDKRAAKKALTRLRKFWKGGQSWPAPIAGYLLGEIDSSTLLEQPARAMPGLYQRYLCKALFWLGFGLSLRGDLEGARDAYRQSVALKEAAVLEFERYLALWELDTIQ